MFAVTEKVTESPTHLVADTGCAVSAGAGTTVKAARVDVAEPHTVTTQSKPEPEATASASATLVMPNEAVVTPA